MFVDLKVSVKGVTPLLMHNRQLANPLNKYAKAIKEYSSKRKKTDADYAEMSRLEWFGGLHVDKDMRPCIPGEVVESTLAESAKKLRLGKDAKAGVFSDGAWPLKFKGPKTLDELFADERFVDVRGVRVQQSVVMRTRPIFYDWSVDFDLCFEDELFNRGTIDQLLKIAGQRIGFLDYRPKFGRFDVVKVA